VVTSAQLAAASFPAALSGYSFAHQLKATTALSSPANGDYALHRQQIEGYRIARLGWGASGAQPIAYAFQFYATASGIAFVKVSNSAKTRCFYQEFAVAAGWNWVTGTIAGDTSGTWQTTTSAGVIFEIFSAGKAASPATPGSWSATSTTQTTNSTNLLAANNNLTLVTGLIVLPGLELPPSSRAPLIMRPFDQELASVQRYWRSSFPYGTTPADNAGQFGSSIWMEQYGFSSGSFSPRGRVAFVPRMRTTPTVNSYNVGTGTAGQWSDGSGTAGANARVLAAEAGGIILDNSDVTLSAATSWRINWKADARL
jgi:hypothetical protein